MDHAARETRQILQVETYGRGGLIHYAYNLSCALGERGHRVALVTAAAYELEGRELPPNLRLLPRIGRLSQRTDRAWAGLAAGLVRKAESAWDALAVARLARRLRPDVVHLHCTNQISLAYLSLLRRTGLPVVSTAHVVTPHERSDLQDAIFRRAHRTADLVIAHSGFDRDRLLEECAIDPGRVAVIPHGEYGFFEDGGERPDRTQARARLGLEPDDEVALFFGYIREYKGLDVLLEAWPAVAAARPRARLVVAGDPVRLEPGRRSELEALAARVGAIHRFAYIPFADVSRYFAAADLVAMPYRHVSQSGVLFLALSLGVPVVASRVGGLPETLEDGVSAALVPPGSPDALARALAGLLGDPALRERLSLGGRRVADHHSWASIAARTEAAYSRLLGTEAPVPQSGG